MRFLIVAFGQLSLLLAVAPVLAQIDTLTTIIDSTTATGGSPMGAYGYNPTNNTMYVGSFGSEGTFQRVNNIDTTPSAELAATQTELQLYLRDGNPDRGATSLMSGILLNPMPIETETGTIPAYSFAVVMDGNRTTQPGNNTVDPSASKRFYTYNLGLVNPPGDAGQIFTTITTLQDMMDAVGTTNTTTNQGRQAAWSGDGQFLYFADSSTAFGGLWTLNPVSCAVNRLAAEDDMTTEPAVVSAGGVDTIYVRGGGSTGNAGGIDIFTYNGTTLGERSVAVTVDALREFLDAGAAGNVYFNNTDSSPERRGIYRRDPQGRLSKVVSYAERDLFFTGELSSSPNPNSNTLRMQTRTVMHATAGEITQVMYAESSPLNLVAGVYAFEPGDFDRDGDLDADDIDLFKPVISLRGVELAGEDNYKFDLNGNSVIDWRDVKVLQQFVGFATGDVDLDGVLDFTDLDTLDANYHTVSGQNAETWLDGDIASFVPGYALSAFDANAVNFADLAAFADAWINDLDQAITENDLTTRYAGQFLADALIAFGFEATPLFGDYNNDGTVDAADYTVWRDSNGATGVGMVADGYADGVIDQKDYDLWRINYSASSIAIAAVPEPTTLLMLLAAGLATVTARRR